ncbi:DUF1538 domain-containing protein [Neiella marina]|uniref:DUF1538 domain-containing protein n=1 Tax=Neiella holothuriorum TaxID=2870530 RepID=A0ABS7EE76_9GAMM|nr:DUF1538 domain-containing protein [Neiella holothuriorum]MBW8190529.1 DUF1538 domain-containing protein [Neiella holothuriorum]
MNWVIEFFSILLDTLDDVVPIAAIIFGFQLFVIRKRIPNLSKVITGFVLVVLGLTFFLLGLEKALFPLGKLMAEQLTAIDPTATEHSFIWVYLFAFAIGASTTIAEPSLIAVALKANQVSGGTISVWGLRIAVALGVAIGISMGAWRIVTGYPIHWFIIAGYVVVVCQTYFAPKMIVPLAYDSGGVTTSTVTVPLVAALGLGLAENIPGRSPMIDGFGLIAFASLFPMISVMAYAQLSAVNAKRAARKSESTRKSQVKP